MVVGEAGAANEGHRLLPTHPLRWRDPALDQIAERRLRSDVEPEFDAGHEGIDVSLFLQEVGLDLERAVWLRGLHPQIAPALRSDETRQDAESVGWDRILRGDLGRD